MNSSNTLFGETERPTTLPAPRTVRWQPLRSGLLNLYKYDHQIFEYERGHLLLRGNNGTGKSRVLALQLPFLLDGDVSSHRVEPDGDAAKRMEWNLLMGRYPDRLGYTWIEFGRRADDGDETLTLGCGLRASSGRRVETWFFITAQRVGESLELTDNGHPLTRDRLQEALGESGQLYRNVRDYRRAVDAALFGLGERRYLALVNLLIQLRQPQLSRHLDESKLSAALSEALPPLSESIVSEVAESFRNLEVDRLALQGFESCHSGIERFLEDYTRYAQVATRRRAEQVRTAHSDYEGVQRQFKEASDKLTANSKLLERVKEEQSRLSQDSDRIAQELRTLEASPEMRSARELDQARQGVAAAEQELARIRADLALTRTRLTEAEGELEQAQDRERDSAQNARQRIQHARSLAAACDLNAEHERALDSVHQNDSDAHRSERHSAVAADDDIANAEMRLAQRLQQRDSSLEVLQQHQADVKKRERALELLRHEYGQVETRLTEAREEHSEAHGFEQKKWEEFLGDYARWRSSCQELLLPPLDEIEPELEEWHREGQQRSPVQLLLEEAWQERQSEIQASRSYLDRRSEQLETERQGVVDERARLQAGQHPLPSPRPDRDDEARHTRPGAPLWSLIDFRKETSAEDRAGIEAALESAGLLDAWITPEGQFPDDERADVYLSARRGTPPTHSLLEVLEVVPDPRVPVAVANDVLRRIGCGGCGGFGDFDTDLAPDGNAVWVSPHGHWCMGNAVGRGIKNEAQHIGETARRRSTQRRLQQLAATEAELDREASNIAAERGQLAERESQLDSERGGAPDEASLVRAHALTETALAGVERTREALRETELRVARARTELEQDQVAYRDAARDLGLEAWVNRLDELAARTRDYERSLDRLWPVLRELAAQHDQSRRCQSRVLSALEETRRREAQERDAVARVGAAVGHRDALEGSIGKTVEEVMAELANQRRLAAGVRARSDDVSQQRMDLEGVTRSGHDRCQHLEQLLTTRVEARSAIVERFAKFLGQRLPELAIPEFATAVELGPQESDLSPTRAIDIARHLERQLVSVRMDDEAWDRIQSSLLRAMEPLKETLSARDYRPEIELVDEVWGVTIPVQGKSLTVSEVSTNFSQEIAQRQALLDERERALIENHLIGDVALHIGQLLRSGEEWVQEVNAELRSRPTSTGMALRFDWQPQEDGPSGLVAARKRLLGEGALWSPEERESVGSFLQQQIGRVRAEQEAGTWREHLVEALDYRAWHRFVIERRQDGKWVRLTKRTHGTGSGGEKAVALTLPQFAAAAAHYRSARPTAPRLILLDEAFVGVDSDMRANCMGLLETFDLDFVMTSEREWGTYPTLGGVAIYQLATRPGIDAVGVTRWIWNGRELLEAEDATPHGRAQTANDSEAQVTETQLVEERVTEGQLPPTSEGVEQGSDD